MAATHESTRPGEGPAVAQLSIPQFVELLRAVVRVELEALADTLAESSHSKLERLIASHDHPPLDPSGLGRRPRRGGRRRDVST